MAQGLAEAREGQEELGSACSEESPGCHSCTAKAGFCRKLMLPSCTCEVQQKFSRSSKLTIRQNLYFLKFLSNDS